MILMNSLFDSVGTSFIRSSCICIDKYTNSANPIFIILINADTHFRRKVIQSKKLESVFDENAKMVEGYVLMHMGKTACKRFRQPLV